MCNIYGAITIAQAMIFCHVVQFNLLILRYYFRVQSKEVVIHDHEICASQTRKNRRVAGRRAVREGHQVALLSGEMQVEQRAAVIERSVVARRKFSLPLTSVLEVYRRSVISQTISILVQDKHDGFVSSTRY